MVISVRKYGCKILKIKNKKHIKLHKHTCLLCEKLKMSFTTITSASEMKQTPKIRNYLSRMTAMIQNARKEENRNALNMFSRLSSDWLKSQIRPIIAYEHMLGE